MRDHIARIVCALSLAMVIVLAAAFAWRHNPRSAAPPPPHAARPADPPASVASAEQVERGRTLFTELDCTTCHSFRGLGNPRRPLDGSSARLGSADLAGWITGTGAPGLSPTVLRRKERYQDLSREDLAALIAFLSAGTRAP